MLSTQILKENGTKIHEGLILLKNPIPTISYCQIDTFKIVGFLSIQTLI